LYETVGPYESLAKVVRLLAVRGYGHALVVGEDDVLLGVVSVKDVARRVLAAFEYGGSLEGLNLGAVLQEQIHSIMSRPPIVLEADSYTACSAAKLMAEKSIGVIPLVDDNGRLVGAVSELNFGFELLSEDSPARNFATYRLLFGEEGETLLEALGRMLESDFRRLPVRSKRELLIATMHSILLAIVRSPICHNWKLRSLNVARKVPRVTTSRLKGPAATAPVIRSMATPSRMRKMQA